MENIPTLTFDQLVYLIKGLSNEEKEKLKEACFIEETEEDPIKAFVLASFQQFETVYKALVN